MIKFLHSGDMGDLVAGLATVKEICERENQKAIMLCDTSGGLYNRWVKAQSQGGGLKFKKKSLEFLQPLLEYQPYVASVKEWDANEKPDYDLNDFRSVFFDRAKLEATNQNLLFAHQYAMGLEMGYKGPWLKVPETPVTRALLVSRSNRYHSSDQVYLLNKFKLASNGNAFMGMDIEYKAFLDCVQTEVGRVAICDALDAAKQIAASAKYIVNGTLFYWIAVGMGHPCIHHELGVDIPTTLFPPQMPNITYWQGLHRQIPKPIDEEKKEKPIAWDPA